MTDHYAHPAPYYEQQTETCGECGEKWQVDGMVEYGSWSPIDESKLICPVCGHNTLEEEKDG
jgi:RNA polymerase subunit RPABC4/transcription elongation factor Spt4